MEIFKENDKMARLIRANYHLLPVINRFGILPGFRDKTVSDICEEKKINKNFFLAIVNTFHNPEFFPQKELLECSPVLIIDYLIRTHHYYTSYVLPKMEQLLTRLISGCTGKCSELNTIDAFYKKYKKELLNHIEYEETVVFPYIKDLEQNIQSPDNKKYSIKQFKEEHSNVENQINDLKNLIIKYLKPVYNVNVCNEFLITLFRFEKDLLDHARIEDHILIPQVVEMEKNKKK